MSDILLHPTFIAKFPWADFPVLDAPSPDDRNQRIRLALSNEFIVGNLQKRYRTPIYQAWLHLAGQLPPVPNIGLADIPAQLQPTTLLDAHTCFRGVLRPHGPELDGASVYIYLLKAAFTVRFDDAPPVPRPVVSRLDDDLVFAVYVKRADNLHRDGEQLWGAALRIELIETDPDDHSLPIDHGTRYDARLW